MKKVVAAALLTVSAGQTMATVSENTESLKAADVVSSDAENVYFAILKESKTRKGSIVMSKMSIACHISIQGNEVSLENGK